MGLRLEVYNENFVGLIADFNYIYDSANFCSSNNVDEAIAYFDLYIDPRTNRLKKVDPNQRVVEKLSIDINNVDDFQGQLETITDELSDEQALQFKLLFPDWNPEKAYEAGDRVRYEGILYKCLNAHEPQQDWIPILDSAVWVPMETNPAEPELGIWEQPEEGNGYEEGAQVIHNGKTWVSQISDNAVEPGIEGSESLWVEVVI